jgi:hypothetical protein
MINGTTKKRGDGNMAELYRNNIVDIDLSKPLKTEQVGMLIASKDSNANMIGVNVYDHGSAVNLTGCAVRGYFTRPDGKTVELVGGASGNRAIVTLNAGCYLVSGRFKLSIKIENASGIRLTVRIVNGFVYATMPEDAPVVPDNPDEPAVVTMSVDDDGNATVTGAILTVDADGNATLTGYDPSVDGDGDATID